MAAGLVLGWLGCSSTYYRDKADSETYATLQEFEAQVFGQATDFTIDTRWSQREPESLEPGEIVEERLGTNTLTLDLDATLQLAFEHSREFQNRKETLYLTALTLSDVRYVFSPQFLATANPDVERESDGDVKFQSRANSQVRMDQMFTTGGRLTATLANDFVRFFTGDPRRELVNLLSVTFSQPLLRGAGKDVVAERLTQAERNVIYAIRDFSFFQKDFATGIVRDYFNLLQLKDQVRNNYENYLSRQNARQRAEARVPVDGQRQADLARQSELRQKNSYIGAIVNYQDALDRFKIRLNLPLGVEVHLDDSALRELEETGLIPLDIDAEAAYRIAVENHMQVLNEIDRFEDARRQIGVSADALRPGLTLVGGADLDWDREEDYRDFNVDEVRANMGLQIDLPIDRLSERNNFRRTLIDFEREIRGLSQTLDTKRQEIEQGLRELDERRLNYENEQLGVIIAKRRVDELEIRMQAGTIDQQVLIDAQDDLLRSQNNRTSALVNYLRARLQLLLDIGMLNTDSEKFWLKPQMAGTEAAPGTSAPADSSQDMIPPSKLFKEEGKL